MTWEKFWSIIDRVRAQADMQDEASVKQFLYTELIKLPQDELLGFDCAWQSYRNKANFPKMVAAACIINDGSSDDRFTDFRNWLIMQGYDAYRQALIDPDNLAALNIPFRDTEWMGCGNVAWYAYAGQKLRTYFEKEGIAAKLFRKYPALLKSSADLHQALCRNSLYPTVRRKPNGNDKCCERKLSITLKSVTWHTATTNSMPKICPTKWHGKHCKAICLQICRKSRRNGCRKTFP